jgi:replication factor C subunit 3/5
MDNKIIANFDGNKQSKHNLPWIEKYRPKTLDDIIDHDEKIATLENLIVNNELLNMLFYGCPGSGKTSMILALARRIYGDSFRRYILELNASDHRGIDVVRNKIVNFVSVKSDKIRLVILDEADAMTQDAQSALRRIIETGSKNSRFCIICNNINKIIPELKSRCVPMRFGYLNLDEIKKKLRFIIEAEKIQIKDDAIDVLIAKQRDFRQILNTLQCMHFIKMGSDGEIPIQKNDILTYLGIPTQEEIDEIIKFLINGKFNDSYKKLQKIFRENRWNIIEFIQYMADQIIDMDIPEKRKFFLLKKFSKIEYRIFNGRDTDIQLMALVSYFCLSKTYK